MDINFAIIGAAGYIAPRHLKAIQNNNCKLVAATDPHTSVGILDQYSFNVQYYPEIERFDKFLEESRRGCEDHKIHWVSVCSPNYLHDSHIRMALHNDANVICEKPLVINPSSLDILQTIEQETKKKVYTVLQLRLHPKLIALKEEIEKNKNKNDYEVVLTYITSRGPWYYETWKGNINQSGGIGTNIGIHLFDLMLWLFGDLVSYTIHIQKPNCIAGVIQLKRAKIRWFLSIRPSDLLLTKAKSQTSFREIIIDNRQIEFTEGFTDLHTQVYKQTLNNKGFDISIARPSIELVHKIKTARIDNSNTELPHPFVPLMTLLGKA